MEALQSYLNHKNSSYALSFKKYAANETGEEARVYMEFGIIYGFRHPIVETEGEREKQILKIC